MALNDEKKNERKAKYFSLAASHFTAACLQHAYIECVTLEYACHWPEYEKPFRSCCQIPMRQPHICDQKDYYFIKTTAIERTRTGSEFA